MPWIKRQFTYNVPNRYMTDDFSEGKTATYEYYGPEYLTVHVDKNTGREIGWCSWNPEEIEVPVALDELRVVIDCKEETLLCELINDMGRDEDAEFKSTRDWATLYKAPEGYTDIEYPVQLLPREIYDESKVKYNFETEEFTFPVQTHSTLSKIDVDKFTWDHFRATRNEMLKATDGVLDDQMPEETRQAWIKYKQLLRDAPEALKNFPPYFAAQMLPYAPSEEADATDLWADIALPDEDDK